MVRVPAYPTLDGLVDLACRDGVDVRPTLLRVLTDLYVQKPSHSAEEETQYVELALRLIEGVDAETRAIVAARLSAYRAAPAAVRERLAAAPSPAPPERLAPAAPRQSGGELADLFFAAHPDERRLILMNLDAGRAPAASHRPAVSIDTLRHLESFALARKVSDFTRTLERALGISRRLAERIVGDASGEPIVVAAKALGMKADMLQRILMFLNPAIGQSVRRVHDLADLFDEIGPAAAGHLAAIWRQAGGQTPVRHESFLWDDERPGARRLASPLPHRAPRPATVPPARLKPGRAD